MILVTAPAFATTNDFSVSGSLDGAAQCASGAELVSMVEGVYKKECAVLAVDVKITPKMMKDIQVGIVDPPSAPAIQASGFHINKLVVITSIEQL